MIISRRYTSESEKCITVESLDNKEATAECKIDSIYNEFLDTSIHGILDSVLLNYFIVTGKDAKTYKIFNFSCHKRNDPKYYEMVVSRLCNSTANAVILDSHICGMKSCVVLYKNDTKYRIFQETPTLIALINYTYTEIICKKVRTLSCMDSYTSYFEHEKTDVVALTELERVLNKDDMKFTDMVLTINTKSSIISSDYNNVILISLN